MRKKYNAHANGHFVMTMDISLRNLEKKMNSL